MLSEQALDGNSLMTAYLDLNEKLDETGIEYESYLQNIGRQLFYTIASSYITLYLAIVFLVVANTIVGVQFLMSQQKTGRRYQTLIRLGATYETPVSYTHLSRLTGLYQMVGEIVPFLYGLCKRKSELNVCRFIAAPKGGHKHFPVCFIRVLDIVKGFAQRAFNRLNLCNRHISASTPFISSMSSW